jgi:hypothetical protein
MFVALPEAERVPLTTEHGIGMAGAWERLLNLDAPFDAPFDVNPYDHKEERSYDDSLPDETEESIHARCVELLEQRND